MEKAIKNFTHAFVVLCVLLLFCLDFVAASFSTTITQFICGYGINLDSEASQQARAEGNALSEKICEEGITLLKNKNNCLPLSEYNLNIFGWGGSDNGFIHQGTGSGAGSSADTIKFYQSLRDAGFLLNEELCADYNDLPLTRKNASADTVDTNIIEASSDFLSQERINQAKSFSDIALVVISRRSGEGADCSKYQKVNGQTRDNGRTYLQLCDEEEDMLRKVRDNFGTVIVVLNTTNVLECGFIDDYDVDAALAVYAPGNRGIVALGRILTGEINPSGRTVDTYAYDHKSNPTYFSSGLESTGMYRGGGVEVAYVDYEESIYVGYLWYETAWADGYFAAQNMDYEDVVQYPFGYGLSYTKFSKTVNSVGIRKEGSEEIIPLSSAKNIEPTDEVVVSVFVENIGVRSGQEVVQLYYSAPYTKGGIEKPAVKLAAFAKTALLAPDGKGEQLELSFSVGDMKSYDCYDVNNNGFMGYELEKGNYIISLRDNAHDVTVLSDGTSAQYTLQLNKDYQISADEVTGETVENRFTTYTNSVSGASSVRTEEAINQSMKAFSVDGSDAGADITYLSRADFAGTFPKESNNTRNMSEELQATYQWKAAPVTYSSDEMPVTGSTKTSYQLSDMLGVDYNDQKWDDIVSQLTKDELFELIANGGYRQIGIESIGKPYCVELDGPQGIAVYIGGKGNSTNYPCETMLASTWNWKLAYQMGLAVASEAKSAGIDGWYAPACNIHRSPYSGRNYEYYSEDACISGVMAAYTVIGAQENGIYPYVKHFAANDTDYLRGGKYTWMTEQALREIYLRPFELAVKDGKAIGIMSSYNRIGATRASGCYSLCTEVLRDEWGFVGSVVTDAFYDTQQQDADECIRSGNNLLLSNPGKSVFHDTTSATAVKAAQLSVKNILYAYVETQYNASIAQGLDLSTAIGPKTAVFPWWVIILVAINVIIIGALLFWEWKLNRQEISAFISKIFRKNKSSS